MPIFYYNSEKPEAAIESILNQHWPKTEIICLVDKKCVQYEFGKKYRSIQELKLQTIDISSLGVSRTLNEGIRLSSGEVVFILFPFVRLLPGFLDLYVNRLYSDESIRAIRSLWSENLCTFKGRFYEWGPVHSNPKPVQPSGLPIIVGGQVDAAARRAASLGDGTFGLTEMVI